MKKNLFKIMITALSIVLIIAAMPFTASAEAVALGEESPFISAQFLDRNNTEVNGNSLVAGERYTVNLVLSDISNVGIFNLTATYTSDIDIANVTSIADVENSGFEYGGYKLDEDNNKFVIVISTVNSNYTELSGDTVMVTLTVEVNTDGDFADFFQISTGRDYTFIIANIDEGNENAYVCLGETQTSTDFPAIDFDMSPSTNIVVSGEVHIASNLTGTQYSTKGMSGIIVAAGDFGGTAYSSVDSLPAGTAYTVTDSDGAFTLNVPNGTTAVTVLGATTINRVLTLDAASTGSSDNIIPVIVCDYNHDGIINAADKANFNKSFGKPANYAANKDFNLDEIVNAADKAVFNKFFLKTENFEYSEFALN